MKSFITEGLLPEDSEVISTHNNLIVASAAKKVVFRIARISSIEQRVDPGDIRYSHRVAWLLGENASVLRPIEEESRRHGDFSFSIFPLMTAVDWKAQEPSALLRAVIELGQAFHEVKGYLTLHQKSKEYVRDRLEYMQVRNGDDRLLMWARAILDYYEQHFPFPELATRGLALVHGDLHAGNAVQDHNGKIFFIDLDSIAIGPRLYDLASWRVRRELGDNAPVEEMVAQARRLPSWNEEQFRILVGWKLLSSVTHILRYAEAPEVSERLRTLDVCGVTLMAPGPWGNFTEGE